MCTAARVPSVDALSWPPRYRATTGINIYIVLDAFTSSGISVALFLRDIIQFSGEFEAEHAVLINEVLDNTENLFLAFVQHPRSLHASTDWTTIFSTARVGW